MSPANTYGKFQSHYVLPTLPSPKTPGYTTINLGNLNWLSADVQACTKPPPIPLNRAAAENVK